MQKKYNETVEMPKVDEEDGWKFIGWSDGENIYKQGEKVVIEDDVVFTATWEKTLTKIELYTEWLNKGEPILKAQLVQAMKKREIKLKTSEIEFAIKGDKLKLGTKTSSGYYTVYLDGSDEYIVTTSKSDNIAFKIKGDQSYKSALNVVNLCLSSYFYGLYNGRLYDSYISDDLSTYSECFAYGANCAWFYLFNYDKLTKIVAIVRGTEGGYSTQSTYLYGFEYLDFTVEDSDVNVDEKYKVIESTDSKMQIYNIFGGLNAERPGEFVTLVEP